MPLFSDILDTLQQTLNHLWVFRPFTSAPFYFRPFIMLIALSIASASVSTLVNLNRSEFQAETMVHTVFPGIVVGAMFSGIGWIVPSASIAALLSALALTHLQRSPHGDHDEASTAIVLTTFFAVGLIISLANGDLSGQLEALMFGRLLELTDQRLLQALIVCVAALALTLPAWRGHLFLAFDPLGARAVGAPHRLLTLALNMATAALVVAAATAVGPLLAIGYVIVPGAAARLLATRTHHMVIGSLICGFLGGYLGLRVALLPTPNPVSPQASVALGVCTLYLVFWGARNILARVHHHPSHRTSLPGPTPPSPSRTDAHTREGAAQ